MWNREWRWRGCPPRVDSAYGGVRRAGETSDLLFADGKWLLAFHLLLAATASVLHTALEELFMAAGFTKLCAVLAVANTVVRVAVAFVTVWSFARLVDNQEYDIPWALFMYWVGIDQSAQCVQRWGRLLLFMPVDITWDLLTVAVSRGDPVMTTAVLQAMASNRMYLIDMGLQCVLPHLSCDMLELLLANPWQHVSDVNIEFLLRDRVHHFRFDHGNGHFEGTLFQFGNDIPPAMQERVRLLMARAGGAAVYYANVLFPGAVSKPCTWCARWLTWLRQLELWSPPRVVWVQATLSVIEK